MRYRDGRYFFTAKPNLNKVILDFDQEISGEMIEEAITEHLREVAGQGRSKLQVYLGPRDAEMVNDPSKATLVLLPWNLAQADQAKGWMERAVTRITNRNLVFFLAPDRAREGELRAAARRWLALQSLQKAQTFRELDKEDQDEVTRQLREKEQHVDALLFDMYSCLFRPAAEGVEEVKLPLKRNGKTLAETVEGALKEMGLLAESLSPEYLSQALGVGKRDMGLAEVESALKGVPGGVAVVDPQRASRDTIREGVEKGLWEVHVGGKVFRDHVPEEELTPYAKVVPRGEVEEAPQPPPSPQPFRLEAVFSGKNIYPLQRMIDVIQGKDVRVTVELADDSGVLAEQCREIEEWLKDYGVPFQRHGGDG